MGDEQLLDIAKQFLQTPEGQKALADQIDVNSLEQQLLSLETSNLTREERREIRRFRRLRRREERRAQIEALRKRLKDQTPQIRSYKISGRLLELYLKVL